MNHYADPGFWRCYASLPGDVRQAADRAFERLRSDPRHPSLHLKKVGRYTGQRASADIIVLSPWSPRTASSGSGSAAMLTTINASVDLLAAAAPVRT